jgi:hypothetical protein
MQREKSEKHNASLIRQAEQAALSQSVNAIQYLKVSQLL